MLVSSKKQKGRLLQKLVCKVMALAGAEFGLVEGDVMSRSMGANGSDCILSPAALRVYGDISIECKNVQSLNVPFVYFSHAARTEANSKTDVMPVLVHKRNGTKPLATVSFADFMALLANNAELRQLKALSAARET